MVTEIRCYHYYCNQQPHQQRQHQRREEQRRRRQPQPRKQQQQLPKAQPALQQQQRPDPKPQKRQPNWLYREGIVNGILYRWVEAGDPSAPLIVLIHGFPQFSYAWRHQIMPLSAAGYRVVALDLRGCNLSDQTAAATASMQLTTSFSSSPMHGDDNNKQQRRRYSTVSSSSFSTVATDTATASVKATCKNHNIYDREAKEGNNKSNNNVRNEEFSSSSSNYRNINKDDLLRYDMESLTSDIHELIVNIFQRDNAVVVGHGLWGGMIAWSFSMRYPSLTKKLVVMNAPHPLLLKQQLFLPFRNWTTKQMLQQMMTASSFLSPSSVQQTVMCWYIYFFQLQWLPELLLGGHNNTYRSWLFTYAMQYSAYFHNNNNNNNKDDTNHHNNNNDNNNNDNIENMNQILSSSSTTSSVSSTITNFTTFANNAYYNKYNTDHGETKNNIYEDRCVGTATRATTTSKKKTFQKTTPFDAGTLQYYRDALSQPKTFSCMLQYYRSLWTSFRQCQTYYDKNVANNNIIYDNDENNDNHHHNKKQEQWQQQQSKQPRRRRPQSCQQEQQQQNHPQQWHNTTTTQKPPPTTTMIQKKPPPLPPTMMLWGIHDQFFLLEPTVLDGLTRLDPWISKTDKIKLVFLDCGHWTPEERPEEVNRHLIQFLSQS